MLSCTRLGVRVMWLSPGCVDTATGPECSVAEVCQSPSVGGAVASGGPRFYTLRSAAARIGEEDKDSVEEIERCIMVFLTALATCTQAKWLVLVAWWPVLDAPKPWTRPFGGDHVLK